jgi:antitoxin component YwqK of YwqJK toxin-antitoxin module
VKNFILLENKMIQLPSGVFAGVTHHACYPDGELEGIKLSEKNMLLTHAGELIPFYTETNRRKNKFSVEFYQNGMIKAIALNEVQEIQTPIGEFPAELVTFFETGELNRFFPLDGKIGGMWSEQEEKALTIPLSFDLPFTTFTAIISGIAFYKSGNIRSITLFPGETICLATKYGEIVTRNGFSLYESGKLESLEPAVPTLIKTPSGPLNAFDPDAVGINADVNSLVFDENGEILALNPAPFGSMQMCSPEDCAGCSLGCR